MQVMVTGKQLNVGDALRDHVETHLADAVSKYFEHAIEASVVFSLHGKGKQVRSEISVHVGRNIQMQGHADAGEAQTAFDLAVERIAKRLRRYKRRLRDHRKTASDLATLEAQQYVLAAGSDDEEEQVAENDQPVVIAEMTTQIDSLTVGEAVMRMDLANTEALVFQNRAHGGINVVYRRSDGNIGWIDPQGNVPPASAR
jgi:ribosomal subunit interface protein